MKINGIDIVKWNARQRRMKIGYREVKNDSEWVPGALLPYFGNTEIGLKKLNIDILVQGENRESIIRDASDLVAEMARGETDILLDDYRNKFKGVLTSAKLDEKVMQRWHILSVEFEAYEYGRMVTCDGIGEVLINNPGNTDSPMAITFQGFKQKINDDGTIEEEVRNSLDIKVIDLDKDGERTGVSVYKIHWLDVKKGIKFDGITGVFDFRQINADVDFWEVPRAHPGDTLVECNADNARLRVEIMPLYM